MLKRKRSENWPVAMVRIMKRGWERQEEGGCWGGEAGEVILTIRF